MKNKSVIKIRRVWTFNPTTRVKLNKKVYSRKNAKIIVDY